MNFIKKIEANTKRDQIRLWILLFLSSFISYLTYFGTFLVLNRSFDSEEGIGLIFYILSLAIFFLILKYILKFNNLYLKFILKGKRNDIIDNLNLYSFIPLSIGGLLYALLYLSTNIIYNWAYSIGKFSYYYTHINKISVIFTIVIFILAVLSATIFQIIMIKNELKSLVLGKRTLIILTSIPLFLFLNFIIVFVLFKIFEFFMWFKDFAGALT